MTYDAAAWGALAFALTILGGVVTFFRWRARGLAALLRGAGVSLLPVAAWLTGLLHLVSDVAGAVVALGGAPGLRPADVARGRALRRRGGAPRGRHPASPARPGGREQRRAGRSAAGASRKAAAPGPEPSPSIGLEDMDDIEAILRKHGIS